MNKEWYKVSDATVRFTVASIYQRSSWDWVAIYKVILKMIPSLIAYALSLFKATCHSTQVGFRHHKDYQAYTWAKGEPAAQVRAKMQLSLTETQC